MDLEKFYKVAPWPMRPDDPKAQARFNKIVKLFSFLLASHPFFEFLSRKSFLRVLDVMAGSGIAGAALARVLSSKKFGVSLTVSDVRWDDLQLVHGWLKDVKGVDVESVVADVSQLHEVIPNRGKYYDIVLLWGLSTPHLDPWKMAKAYASICHLLKDDGVMLLDEVDRVFNIFYRIGYKDFLVEGESGKDVTVISIHRGYDKKLGVFQRTTYTLPEFRKIATLNYRFWDLAGISALGWIFFSNVDVVPPKMHNVQEMQHVILLSKPRRKISPYDLKKEPVFISTKD